MMPLNLANVGEETLILKVGGNPEIRKHLADLGFVPGGKHTFQVAWWGKSEGNKSWRKCISLFLFVS